MAEPELVIDADGHVDEPEDLWDERLEAPFRGRGPRVERRADGARQIVIEGFRPFVASPFRAEGEVAARLRELGGDTSANRLVLLDEEGVDVSILYPSMLLALEGMMGRDPDHGMAVVRVYNDWVVEWCAADRSRLVPIAYAPLFDLAGAAEEVRRVAARGARGAAIVADNPRNIPYGDPALDPLYAVCTELGLPLAVHISTTRTDCSVPTPYFEGFKAPWFQAALTSDLTKWAITMMLQGGVFDRFPQLQVVMLESMGGWVPSWLERMDEFYEDLGHTTAMSREPSSYFGTNLYVSISPHERGATCLLRHCGADRVLWATDFPHPDSRLRTLPAMRQRLAELSEDDAQRVLGRNAQTLYGL